MNFNYIIVPYLCVDGIPTWRDSDIARVYDQIVSEELYQTMFATEFEMPRDLFISMMKSSSTIFMGVLDKDGVVAGIGWLNRFEGKIARMHFCVFKKWWGRSAEIMGTIREYIHSLKGEDGSPLFIRFIGYIPSRNIFAVKCALRDGCTLCGIIPNYFWDYTNGKSIEATVVYM